MVNLFLIIVVVILVCSLLKVNVSISSKKRERYNVVSKRRFGEYIKNPYLRYRIKRWNCYSYIPDQYDFGRAFSEMSMYTNTKISAFCLIEKDGNLYKHTWKFFCGNASSEKAYRSLIDYVDKMYKSKHKNLF